VSKAQFLYRVTLNRPTLLTEGPTETEQRLLSEHFAYLQDLTQRGVMILVGRTQTTGPETFGIAIFEADDEAAARAIMNADPAVSSGLMRGELFPYRIALMRGAPPT
jgi:uncharacterized protein YciI